MEEAEGIRKNPIWSSSHSATTSEGDVDRFVSEDLHARPNVHALDGHAPRLLRGLLSLVLGAMVFSRASNGRKTPSSRPAPPRVFWREPA